MPFPGSSTASAGNHRSQAPSQSGYFAPSVASATLTIIIRAPATLIARVNFRQGMVSSPFGSPAERQQLWKANARADEMTGPSVPLPADVHASPAVNTDAAVSCTETAMSRWQLAIEYYSNCPRMRMGSQYRLMEWKSE